MDSGGSIPHRRAVRVLPAQPEAEGERPEEATSLHPLASLRCHRRSLAHPCLRDARPVQRYNRPALRRLHARTEPTLHHLRALWLGTGCRAAVVSDLVIHFFACSISPLRLTCLRLMCYWGYGGIVRRLLAVLM